MSGRKQTISKYEEIIPLRAKKILEKSSTREVEEQGVEWGIVI